MHTILARRSAPLRRWALFASIALAASGCGYNTIQTYDEQAEQAKRNIEVQLQRRADLIPNLVNTVKGYAAQESEILNNVARANAGLVGALQRPGGTNPEELANANANVTRALGPFMTLVQAYPQLQSNEQFLRLQDELTGTENRIAVSRRDYNQAVTTYNTYIRKFPATLTARATGAKPRQGFEVTDPTARQAPTVDFTKAPAPGAAPAAAPGAAPAARP
jgi:LemA protein